MGISASARSVAANLDWDTWQGTAPKKPFDPLTFARWRCWKEYGTGVAGRSARAPDQRHAVRAGHQRSPRAARRPSAASSAGKMAATCPMCTRCCLNTTTFPCTCGCPSDCESPEITRFQGSKGAIELREFSVELYAASRRGPSPSYYTASLSGAAQKCIREAVARGTRSDAGPGACARGA